MVKSRNRAKLDSDAPVPRLVARFEFGDGTVIEVPAQEVEAAALRQLAAMAESDNPLMRGAGNRGLEARAHEALESQLRLKLRASQARSSASVERPKARKVDRANVIKEFRRLVDVDGRTETEARSVIRARGLASQSTISRLFPAKKSSR